MAVDAPLNSERSLYGMNALCCYGRYDDAV